MAQSFSEALMAARRKAQLQGRPMTNQESSGIAEGYAATSGDEAFRLKQLEEEKIQRKAQQAAAQKEYKMNLISTGASVGSAISPGIGTLIGAGVGWDTGNWEDKTGKSLSTVKGNVANIKDTTANATLSGSVTGVMGPTLPVNTAAKFNDKLPSWVHKLASGCIIVTACTSSDSYEVNIAREYRDKYLDERTKSGYYKLASVVAPSIKKHSALKWIVKRVLVDRLIDFGECAMNKKTLMKYKTSPLITHLFLAFCKWLGR
jgi:hypothetical protein